MNRTKRLIIDVFWQFLEEKPYNKITVQNIVDCCQMNRNTFYYHFQDIPALAEYSIEEWANRIIADYCEFGSLRNCIIPIAQELVRRKKAFLNIYRSAHRDEFMRYLNKIGFHIVQSYVENATKNLDVLLDDSSDLIRYYKCVFVGVVYDWLDAGTAYDLLSFCEKICSSFEGAGKRALLGQAKETLL